MIQPPAPHPNPTITTLAWLGFRVRQALAPHGRSDTKSGLLITYFYYFLTRAVQRLTTLFDKWKAGTYKPAKPRAKRAKKPRDPQAEALKPIYARILPLPRSPGWLLRLVQPTAIGHGGLNQMLEDPEFRQFLTEVTGARRTIRTLATAFLVDLPTPIAAPKRARKPRPKVEKPPKREGLYPRFNIRTYSPGMHLRRRKKRA